MKDFSIIAVIIPRSLPCVVKSSIIWNHSMSVLTTSHLGLSLWVTPIWEYLWPWPPVMSSRTWDLDLDLESRDLDDLEQGELEGEKNLVLDDLELCSGSRVQLSASLMSLSPGGWQHYTAVSSSGHWDSSPEPVSDVGNRKLVSDPLLADQRQLRLCGVYTQQQCDDRTPHFTENIFWKFLGPVMFWDSRNNPIRILHQLTITPGLTIVSTPRQDQAGASQINLLQLYSVIPGNCGELMLQSPFPNLKYNV